ncbi:MAG TPA: hypothetical protein VEI97_03715 [bacterium]|nr:hypothetical protein [bacterium]
MAIWCEYARTPDGAWQDGRRPNNTRYVILPESEDEAKEWKHLDGLRVPDRSGKVLVYDYDPEMLADPTRMGYWRVVQRPAWAQGAEFPDGVWVEIGELSASDAR